MIYFANLYNEPTIYVLYLYVHISNMNVDHPAMACKITSPLLSLVSFEKVSFWVSAIQET